MWTYANPSPYELCHYGVLGMKWGQRKAANYTKKANAARKKGKNSDAEKYQNKASSETKKTNAKSAVKASNKEIRTSLSTGRRIGSVILAGPLSVRLYSSLRTAGNNKGASVAITALSAMGSIPLQAVVLGVVNNYNVNQKL